MERPASKATLQIRGPNFIAALVLDEHRERVVREEHLALDVVHIEHAVTVRRNQFAQAALSLNQREFAQVPAIEPQQVEGTEPRHAAAKHGVCLAPNPPRVIILVLHRVFLLNSWCPFVTLLD